MELAVWVLKVSYDGEACYLDLSDLEFLKKWVRSSRRLCFREQVRPLLLQFFD